MRGRHERELGARRGDRLSSWSTRPRRRVSRALAGSGLADGVTPADHRGRRRAGPGAAPQRAAGDDVRGDPARWAGSARSARARGGAVTLAELGAGEAYLNKEAADELGVAAGDRIAVLAGGRPSRLMVRDVVSYDGAGTDESPCSCRSPPPRLIGRPGRSTGCSISNRGGAIVRRRPVRPGRPRTRGRPSRRWASRRKRRSRTPSRRPTRRAAPSWRFFTTFGSFSIAAGVLLIFLIFVMLAAERRSELGIARAVGTRRGHLVEMFMFEGAAYDLAAALVGALLGAVVAYVMVVADSQAFGSQGIDIEYSVTARSLAIAYALGVLLTLVVVAISAWRVSLMTISTAIRNLPEPTAPRRRRWTGRRARGLALGALLVVSGASAARRRRFSSASRSWSSASCRSLRAARRLRADRVHVLRLALVVFLMMPWSVLEDDLRRRSRWTSQPGSSPGSWWWSASSG